MRGFDIKTEQVLDTFDFDNGVTLRLPDGNLLTAGHCSLEFRLDTEAKQVQEILLTVKIGVPKLTKVVRSGLVMMSQAELDRHRPEHNVTLLLRSTDTLVELANLLYGKQEMELDQVARHGSHDSFLTYFDLANFDQIDPRQVG